MIEMPQPQMSHATDELLPIVNQCRATTHATSEHALKFHCSALTGGTFGNGTSLTSAEQCHDVVAGWWAPTGSSLPVQCPPSGFRCPGRRWDREMDPPGSKPIIVSTGGLTHSYFESVTRRSTVQRVSLVLTVLGSSYNATEIQKVFAAAYGVPVQAISLRGGSSGRRGLNEDGGPHQPMNVTVVVDPAFASLGIEEFSRWITSVDVLRSISSQLSDLGEDVSIGLLASIVDEVINVTTVYRREEELEDGWFGTWFLTHSVPHGGHS